MGELFNSTEKIAAISNLDILDIAYLVSRGGWLRATLQNKKVSLERAFDYYDAVVSTDIRRVDEVARNLERVKLLM
jgi:hypothetical protein